MVSTCMSAINFTDTALRAATNQQPQSMSKDLNINSKAYSYKLFKSIHDVDTAWEVAAPTNDLFLQRHYLSSLEALPPIGMRFAYLVFYAGNDPIGLAYLQIKYFKADENIGELTEAQKVETKLCFFSAFSTFIKRKVASKVAADVLIVGNMLLTGEHGYHFDYSRISELKALELLESACVDCIPKLANKKVRMPVIFIKDVLPTRKTTRKQLETNGFARFEIQPNMELELQWDNFEDFKAAMTTKYRTRVKRAVKKLGAVEKREMSLEEIKEHHALMYSQYHAIASNAVFNMVDLHTDYFWALKELMPAHFKVYGYFEEEKLLGFYTTFLNGNELEAHFLGYDKAQNQKKQIYQNMLYDLLQAAMNSHCKKLILGRTALEIKSTLGAEPIAMDCFLRHQNSLANRFTGTMLDYFNPVEEWTQRKPFKKLQG